MSKLRMMTMNISALDSGLSVMPQPRKKKRTCRPPVHLDSNSALSGQELPWVTAQLLSVD